MYENEKKEIIKAGLALKEYQLIALSGGNVSMRLPDGKLLVTPSGMAYDTMIESDVVVMDIEGKVLEGERRPSVDSVALLHIYRSLSRVNAIIHTHQVYATAISLVFDKVPNAVTTLANACAGEVFVAPFSSAASFEMGKEAVEHIGGSNAVILKNHGVITVGKTLKEALYAAVYLEDAVKTYFVAKSMGEPKLLTDAQFREAVEVFKDYGQ
ncbi:MAG: class II aldolase/adducin family protein [Spirochaetales bacterium]|nr:MAG: class II aldolase/adducin family protein [Spirochaetales bacterium]